MKRAFAIGLVMLTTAAQSSDPRRQMMTARTEANAARQRAAQLEAQARSASDAAERARAAQAGIAAQLQAAEADMTAAESRLAILDQLRRAQERRLARQQQPIVRLIAALQTMARRPAAAALVQPGTVGDIIHVRALLGAMTPQIAARTAGLREEIAQARRLRTAAATAVTQLRDSQRQRAMIQGQLAKVEAEQRARSTRLSRIAALEAQRARAIADSTRNLQDLVGRLDIEARRRGLPQDTSEQPNMRLAYRLPVLGRITRGFGEALPSGGRSRGVSIAARPGAIVVAPAAGRVSFAGLYRGYGAIAIIDHGDGFASVVTGLASNFARVGDTVSAGGPLGRAGSETVMVELRRDGAPIDLAPFIG